MEEGARQPSYQIHGEGLIVRIAHEYPWVSHVIYRVLYTSINNHTNQARVSSWDFSTTSARLELPPPPPPLQVYTLLIIPHLIRLSSVWLQWRGV